MPCNKSRLYIALYPSGVVDNEERKSEDVEPNAVEVISLGRLNYQIDQVFEGSWLNAWRTTRNVNWSPRIESFVGQQDLDKGDGQRCVN
ncbi:hypothetical protein HYQ45_018837 [Verticillium longisporum]|uniref:Uncharacterized protein n=1 Tax=Verticillium longisporum TaxID=100787 RepID=A0A8I2ZVH5_VERLO|nr:hypothetical protein HYQ45_018837 [Verticillium longisporum]